MGLSPEEFLRKLGFFWVTYTGEEGYGDMFSLWGDDMYSFLENLDLMHSRVKSTMPALEPPSFTTRTEQDGRIRLTYNTHRDGMAPMVLGLLEGLAVKFKCEVNIEHVVHRAEAGHDEFLLNIQDG